MNDIHIPVLADEVLEVLAPKVGESYLDLTAGYGGHASLIINQTKSPEDAFLVDQDQVSINYLKKNLPGTVVVHSNYLDFLKESDQQFDLILLDLGVSSLQLDDPSRGFSFRYDAPLDMRMNQAASIQTAAELIRSKSESELAKILLQYGEERQSKKLARLIKEQLPSTTTQLAEICKSVYLRHQKSHPATRTFQALRIAVNDELGVLWQALELLPQHLNPGGRIAIISFHSLEDRLVKKFFLENSNTYDAIFIKQGRILPSNKDIKDGQNPRARSAILRFGIKSK